MFECNLKPVSLPHIMVVNVSIQKDEMYFVSFIHTPYSQGQIPTASPPPLNSPVDILAAVQIWQGVSVYHKNPNKWECLGGKYETT